ncbi:unnamed protein product [Rotaria sp. Silwood1]|nr:unnamed protein product [Rotaria sp. Silwood1]CAF1409307.1 unnamed protein product [Rotaria sp. Silwood1]CAF3600628.1 unnamed protein product [Rotaria sp. Silwood1]CAF4803671.1 unnamed protein product [Rotaria sp. Silwood1]
MSSFLLRHVKLTQPQLSLMLQHQCRVEASTSSSASVIQQNPIVLDNTKPPPPLDADRMRMHPRIGNREIVGYGLKGKPEYFDLVMFPCPSIRWEADTPAIAELRKKEKGDWKQLSVDEKKKLYRASFRQTFEEFTAPTGVWKWTMGCTLITIAGLIMAYDAWRRVAYNFEKPDSFSDEKLKRQLQYHIAARQGPMRGLSSKWDYETVLFIYYCSSTDDIYKEELYIRPLSTGHTYFNLLFTTLVSPDILKTDIIHHYHLFPKAIADIVRSNGVNEFHVSLTQGLWRYDHWGMPIVGSPPGAEVWSWFKPNEQQDVTSRWTSFVHELGGILCASLNFVDSNVSTSSPYYSFRPQSTLPISKTTNQDNSFVRYGVLPREIVCTENLTPWKKLLPCVAGGSNHKGLAGLLDNAPKLHHSNYHSLRMDLRQICANVECTSTQLELSMALAIVVDGTTSKLGHNEWTFRSIFGSNVAQICPLSSLTNIYVDLQLSQTHSFNLSPEPDYSFEQGKIPIIVYDLHNEKRKSTTFSLNCNYNKQQTIKIDNQNDKFLPPIVVHRYATGYSVRDGGIKTIIKLNEKEKQDEITLVYFEQIPWYFRIFLHTLKITTLDNNRTEIKPDYISYVPGKDRKRPYQLELVIKTKQSILINFEFEMAFLKWNEFPPDPNHGFYIPSAVISTIIPSNYILQSLNSFSLNQSLSSSSDGFVRLYSETLLVNLPTPDFSMPFNVICLGCTAVALAFGGLHNLTTKEFVFSEKRPKISFRQRLQDLRFRVMAARHALAQRIFRTRSQQQQQKEHSE